MCLLPELKMTSQTNETTLQVLEKTSTNKEKTILIDTDSYIDHNYKNLFVGLRKIYGNETPIYAFVSRSKTILAGEKLKIFERISQKFNVRMYIVYSVLDKIKTYIMKENTQKFYIVSENPEYIKELIKTYPPSLIEFVNASKGTTIINNLIKDRSIPFFGTLAALPKKPEIIKDKYVFNRLFIPKQKTIRLVKILKDFGFTTRDIMVMNSIGIDNLKIKPIIKKLPMKIDKLKEKISNRISNPDKANAVTLALITYYNLKVDSKTFMVDLKNPNTKKKKGEKNDNQDKN